MVQQVICIYTSYIHLRLYLPSTKSQYNQMILLCFYAKKSKLKEGVLILEYDCMVALKEL